MSRVVCIQITNNIILSICLLCVCELLIDLGVAAVKSTWSTWPLQVKSFQFQVAAEIFHLNCRRIQTKLRLYAMMVTVQFADLSHENVESSHEVVT